MNLPIGDGTVDLVVTSPPFFGLRSYRDGGEHYDGQVGAEATPAEFVDALIAATEEMVRVLKPSGSIWVNLGDRYVGKPPGPQGGTGQRAGRSSANEPARARRVGDTAGQVRQKSLQGIPWRYAIRCIDDLGLILRAEAIWSKASSIPESVKDRVRRSHESWFHFTVSPHYYSAVDLVREPYSPQSVARSRRAYNAGDTFSVGTPNTLNPAQLCNPFGKLPGSVWEVPTSPLRIPDTVAHARCCGGVKRDGCTDGLAHHAAFPVGWPRRIITGWSPRRVCTVCGAGLRPVNPHPPVGVSPPFREEWFDHVCDCREPGGLTVPGVVLDPFGGTGTTALAASALGRDAITVDLSSDYCDIARWRTADPDQLRRAAG